MRVALALLLAAGAATLGCADKTAPPPAAPTGAPTAAPATASTASGFTARTVRDLAVIARGKTIDADEAADIAADLDGADDLGAFIDAQLADKAFARVIALPLLFGGNISVKRRHPVAANTVLRRSSGGVFFLRKACAEADAVDVDPWWAPGKTVKVCPDAYRPDSHGDAEGRTCGASMLAPGASPVCGCGPRLMYCVRDGKQYDAVRRALKAEVVDTVAHVVSGDGPIDPLFAGNGTVRNRLAEFVYRRARVAAGEDPAVLDMDDFSKKARLAPRGEQVAGHHAGVLTSPALIYGSDALRGVMRNYHMYLWCSEPARSKVSTAAVMKLGKVDLRVGDGWKALASMDVCTDCHARLDYGMQFFKGFPSSVNGVDFRPKQSLTGKGPMYGADIRDKRGEGALNPRGFAQLAMAQPEFGECLTRRVVDHVFSGQGTTDDFDAVEAAFMKTRNLKQMMKVAMLRYAQRPLAPAAPSALPGATAAVDADTLPVSAGLRRLLDNHCAECHDEGDRHPFDAETQPRETVAEMLELVAFGVMPATPRGMDDTARRQFIDAIVPVLWPAGASRDAARAYFTDAYRAFPVHRFGSAMTMVAERGGADKRVAFNAVENNIRQSEARYSPGFAAASGVTALAACKKSGATGDALVKCIAAATDPAELVIGGVAPGE